MARRRGVAPNTTTLPLSDGDSILIKDRLTAGEENDITSYSMDGYQQSGDGKTTVKFNPGRNREATAAIYIVGWSLINQAGQPIPWLANASLTDRIATIRALDSETMREIEEALTKHRQAQQAAREGNATSEEAGTGAASPSAA